MEKVRNIDWSFLWRLKVFKDEKSISRTRLKRELNFLDVLTIGIGSTLGSGIYILTGDLVRNWAGPATIISFIVAGTKRYFYKVLKLNIEIKEY